MLKEKVYGDLIKSNDLNYDKELKFLSPKMYKILDNMKKFIDKKSTGKILFYSDFFRSDEVLMVSNGIKSKWI